MDDLNQLREAIENAECDLEEISECGDLEERLTASLHLADLQSKLDALKANYEPR